MHIEVYELVDLYRFNVQSLIFQLSRTQKSLTKYYLQVIEWNGAQAGIRTRVLRATAAYTGPNYTTWALSAATILITLAN